ncbi:hypothetical protein PPL_12385 [Heterostelium album PN500]|uniref:Uncharacterized protein n=1 Tax=Heterostelium pallidum (strain ATCC 26659 / Pp 5 / PN500) TaxID=670386 RepID=D3BMG5_HETP5|nr:hypothetical protein PPL_12385 [Heterostelium album PN500]EFA77177.1 hypothetical protein PPL_12385 [Heterostelium album PN500]|eukprot:XP_020429306.1 hypothetical protein PPL_12385 [Heterostelium album PN500]
MNPNNETNEILSLYSPTPNIQWIEENFDNNCQFDGPAYSLSGKENIIEIFRAISVYTKSMKVEKSVSSVSNRDIHIDANFLITFKYISWYPLKMRLLLVVHKNFENKITRFEENIFMESLIQNIPLVNYMYFQLVKPSFGYLMVKMGMLSKIKVENHMMLKQSSHKLNDSHEQKNKNNQHHEPTMSEMIKEKMKEAAINSEEDHHHDEDSHKNHSTTNNKKSKENEKKSTHRKQAMSAQPITN